MVLNREQTRRFLNGLATESPVSESLKKQLEQHPGDSTFKVSVTGELANTWAALFMAKGVKR